MRTLVLINGEAQVGKSTFANALKRFLAEHEVDSEVYSFVAPFRGVVKALWWEVNPGAALEEEPTYDQMKKELIAGVSGRDWMISMGNMARNLSGVILPRIMFHKWNRDINSPDIYIVENLGFQDELDECKRVCTESGIKLVTIHLRARASRSYDSGEQFDNDNRFDLSAVCEHQDPRVNYIASLMDTEILDDGGDVLRDEFLPAEVEFESPHDTEMVDPKEEVEAK